MFFLIYFVMMIRSIYITIYGCIFSGLICTAQTEQIPFALNTTEENRAQEYRYLVNNSITKNLSLPLTDSTEEYWEDAFYAMELINYQSAFTDAKIRLAFDSVENRSIGFQRALMQLIYSNYTTEFKNNVSGLFLTTTNAKVFAMCAEYLLRADRSVENIYKIAGRAWEKNKAYGEQDIAGSYILFQLFWRIINLKDNGSNKINLKLPLLLSNSFLKGNTVVYSFQRKNRNYPGMAIVRDGNGFFFKNEKDEIFSVTQLARSTNNLPGYLTNGNTPQGIFRMNGFAISNISAIGPSENIQLMMPFETSVSYFLKDSTLKDSTWAPWLYQRLLPPDLQNYFPLLQTYFSSAIGRTEIIAHGTTVNPEYYKNKPYYPLTPTMGCLTSKEIWSTVDGKRTESDQQKLVNAVKAAGGADGYCIVIEIDDQHKPVSIYEILPYLNQKIK